MATPLRPWHRLMCRPVQIISLLALNKLELHEMINQLELTEGLLAPFNNFCIIEALAQSGAHDPD